MEEKSTAEKIKELRLLRGLTLEQVATVVGVGKSTVRKWEVGMIANMRNDKIKALAKALGTTPEYLMGWDDAEHNKNASPTELPLSEGEKRLLELFNRVPEDKQQLVLQMIRAALESL